MPELSMVWYVEADGASYRESANLSRVSESWRPTGGHELWVLDSGEVLARAGAGVLSCAPCRPSVPRA